MALEYQTNANAQPQQTANQTQSTETESQWIDGVDNSVVLLGGAGALALLLILTK